MCFCFLALAQCNGFAMQENRLTLLRLFRLDHSIKRYLFNAPQKTASAGVDDSHKAKCSWWEKSGCESQSDGYRIWPHTLANIVLLLLVLFYTLFLLFTGYISCFVGGTVWYQSKVGKHPSHSKNAPKDVNGLDVPLSYLLNLILRYQHFV